MPQTITLYRDLDKPGQYTWSAFVCKLETHLRFSHLPYNIKGGSLSESPKGKLPYVKIVDEKTGKEEVVSDSGLIVKMLVENGVIADLDEGLSRAEKASGLAIRALCEDKIYFFTGKERWIDNFYIMRDIGPLAFIPWPLRYIVGHLAYNKVHKTMFCQGTGRYSQEEFDGLRLEAWSALDTLVAEHQASEKEWKSILGGETPASVDACLFGFLASTLTCPANPKTKAVIQSLPHLMKYANAVHDEYFPDYEKWT